MYQVIAPAADADVVQVMVPGETTCSLPRPTIAVEPISIAPLAVQAASLAAAIEQLERDYITGALDQTGRNIAAAARLLGLTRRGLYLKMSRLGVAPPS